MLCLLKNCRKCSGDLVLDGEEWRCWQCGQYYYPITESLDQREEPPNPSLAAAIGEIMPSPRKTRVRRSPRNLNSRIVARDLPRIARLILAVHEGSMFQGLLEPHEVTSGELLDFLVDLMLAGAATSVD